MNSSNEDRTEGTANAGAHSATPQDFIRERITQDLAAGRHGGRVHTRFPPEPNGYLHIGHAKSICLNFGVAEEFGGLCNLRFDDTNPVTEDTDFVKAIERDVRWLGFDWEDRLHFASDYFPRLYAFAEELVRKGLAYVCDLPEPVVKEQRGTVTTPGVPSPYRDRTPEQNLDLLRRMRAGEFPDGSRSLRARIDMSHPNMKMRDPVIYRIRRAHHHRTGDTWCIYPLYDFTHCLSDSLEGITHSLCTLEFENNRALYDWFLEVLDVPHRPQQIEFARLNLNYTLMSKRKLRQLVEAGTLSGWDDPRLPTISGMRRRGFPPAAIRRFCHRVGVARRDSVVDVGLLEHTVRDQLNHDAPRVMGVLDPLKVVIENYPEDRVEQMEVPYFPKDEQRTATRPVPFSRELWIERCDFMEDPPRKFFRLAPGREVRLRRAYYITCTDVVRDDQGRITELRCTYDPATRGGWSEDGRKVRGTLHWVSARHAVDAEIRIYDRLFRTEDPEEGGDWQANLNPDSLQVIPHGKLEPGLAQAEPGSRWQFERNGYFCIDPDTRPDHLVVNRTLPLRDSWARIARRQKGSRKRG